jgi:hypothetical protein
MVADDLVSCAHMKFISKHKVLITTIGKQNSLVRRNTIHRNRNVVEDEERNMFEVFSRLVWCWFGRQGKRKIINRIVQIEPNRVSTQQRRTQKQSYACKFKKGLHPVSIDELNFVNACVSEMTAGSDTGPGGGNWS